MNAVLVTGAAGMLGRALVAALAYSDLVFAGAVLVWLSNSLVAVVRGTGNMAMPSKVFVIGAVGLLLEWALLAVARRLAVAPESSDDAAMVLAESIVSLLGVEGCLVSSLEDGYFRVDAAAGKGPRSRSRGGDRVHRAEDPALRQDDGVGADPLVTHGLLAEWRHVDRVAFRGAVIGGDDLAHQPREHDLAVAQAGVDGGQEGGAAEFEGLAHLGHEELGGLGLLHEALAHPEHRVERRRVAPLVRAGDPGRAEASLGLLLQQLVFVERGGGRRRVECHRGEMVSACPARVNDMRFLPGTGGHAAEDGGTPDQACPTLRMEIIPAGVRPRSA